MVYKLKNILNKLVPFPRQRDKNPCTFNTLNRPNVNLLLFACVCFGYKQRSWVYLITFILSMGAIIELYIIYEKVEDSMAGKDFYYIYL